LWSARRLKRSEIACFFADFPACLVGTEACATAHYWARLIGPVLFTTLAIWEALQRDLEAARYAADRALRQYDAADPANRPVTAELETRWNGAAAGRRDRSKNHRT
jgi:transposase